mgnify:FL=1
MTFARRFAGLCVAASLGAALLAGCAPLFLGGVAGASFAAADRRSVGTQVEDQRIQTLGTQRIKAVLDGSETAYAYVNSYNRRALLTGLAPTEAARARAEQIVKAIDNVREVHNEIVVASPAANASAVRDTVTSTRVRSALLEDKEIESTSVKVITEARTVYLMGLVSESEGKRIAEIASRTPGVEKVVTLYDYMSDQEYAAMRAERERQAAKNAPPRN